MKTKLPTAPDFAAIDAQSIGTADERTNILALIGSLVFTWSNNESMFIYFLMVLLKTDFSSAAITFVSLNTTRARLDLVRRLAKEKIDDPEMVRRVEKLIERFNACTKIRNEFNHCIYQLNEAGQFTHTTILRVTEKKSDIQFAEVREFDTKRINEMTRTIGKLTQLNRDLWDFLPSLEAHIASNKKPAKTKSRQKPGR